MISLIWGSVLLITSTNTGGRIAAEHTASATSVPINTFTASFCPPDRPLQYNITPMNIIDPNDSTHRHHSFIRAVPFGFAAGLATCSVFVGEQEDALSCVGVEDNGVTLGENNDFRSVDDENGCFRTVSLVLGVE
jgi:hypothetical protein